MIELVSDTGVRTSRHMKQTTAFIGLALLVLAIFVRPWWEKEETNVYTAILQQCFTDPRETTFLIQRETHPLTHLGVPSFHSSVLGLEWSARASYFFKNLFEREIPPTIQSPKKIIYIRATDWKLALSDVPLTSQSKEIRELYSRNWGIYTFSRVGFNFGRNRAVVYVENICGLCGEGFFALLVKKNGIWIVEKEAGTWISQIPSQNSRSLG
jgi:hypothetical protein